MAGPLKELEIYIKKKEDTSVSKKEQEEQRGSL